WLLACDLLCVPSVQESFGGVYTEAWSFGKPVIGCPIPAVAAVIADQKDGILVNQDPEAIAQGIIRILRDPEWARELGRRGFEKVKSRYGWEQLAEKTLAAYQYAVLSAGHRM
ncbi:MAG: glycosyltransferase family 4 protein, partial [Thermostichales cyanobacterium SZTDM-1c_bins_54]